MQSYEVIASLMMSAVVSAKNTHWQNPAGTYGVHYNIDTFVDEVWETLDTFVEVSSGIGGTYKVEVDSNIVTVDVAYLENLYQTIDSLRESVEAKSLQSIIDDFQNSTLHLIYRLKNIR